MAYERVHIVWDYYDCPREGIADFQGRPHLYKCQFSKADDDWTDLYWLMQIDEETFALAKERNEIFVRWKAEFRRGTVTLDTHPARPLERTRYERLQSILGERLNLKPENSVTKRALFDRGFERVEWLAP
jgi:hypothetical protein